MITSSRSDDGMATDVHDMRPFALLASIYDGTYIGVRDVDHDGEPGLVLTFRWDDADDADRFVDALDMLFDQDVEPFSGSRIVRVTTLHEDGVVTTCVVVDDDDRQEVDG